MDVDDFHGMCLYSGAPSISTGSFCPSFFFSFSDDHSRVRLQTIEGDTNSDYINGNYIDVCTQKLSASPTILTQTTWCVCHKTGGHMSV